MLKYLVPLVGLTALLFVVAYAQEDGEKSEDLEQSEFLFRPVYIRYGWQPSQGSGWKGEVKQQGGWGQSSHN